MAEPYIPTPPENAAGHLRRSAKPREPFVTVEEELEYVNTYLTLEQARFGDKPKVRMKLDPRVLNLRIPVLTIQPLVENAGGHGLAPEEDWGWVMVSSRIRRDELRLIVADRGVVILPERLAHVFGAGGKNPKVVFVTAYEEYAVNAFKVRATDYLLKPFDDARLDDTVQRLLEGRNGREARPEGKKPQPSLAGRPRRSTAPPCRCRWRTSCTSTRRRTTSSCAPSRTS